MDLSNFIILTRNLAYSLTIFCLLFRMPNKDIAALKIDHNQAYLRKNFRTLIYIVNLFAYFENLNISYIIPLNLSCIFEKYSEFIN